MQLSVSKPATHAMCQDDEAFIGAADSAQNDNEVKGGNTADWGKLVTTVGNAIIYLPIIKNVPWLNGG